MRAVLVEAFGAPPRVADVPDPAPPADGVVVRVLATGVCRSDWHAWQGHDDGVALPHVPGHELAGEVVAVGADVRRWRVGDLVTVPFVEACGTCPACLAGEHQVCLAQEQPGFTHWGSFAELVALHRADVNLVALPEGLAPAAAAVLGCRATTAFRAVVDVAAVRPGEVVAVHGCGGVGLSAVAVAAAAGARVLAVDVDPAALELARACGADDVLDASGVDDVGAAVRERTGGGAHVSLDAVGSQGAVTASVRSLRWRGRHVQVGLLGGVPGGAPTVPLDRVVALELAVLGSHGIAAHRVGAVLDLVARGALRPDLLVTRRAPLAEGPAALAAMSWPAAGAGVTVLEPAG